MAGYTFTPVSGTGGYAEQNPIPTVSGRPVLTLKGKWKTSAGLRGSETYWKAGQEVRIDEELCSRHVLAIGGTGSGKTNLLFTMLDQIYGGMNANDVMIVFDSKGDYYKRFSSGKPMGSVAVLGNSSEYARRSVKWNISGSCWRTATITRSAGSMRWRSRGRSLHSA